MGERRAHISAALLEPVEVAAAPPASIISSVDLRSLCVHLLALQEQHFAHLTYQPKPSVLDHPAVFPVVTGTKLVSVVEFFMYQQKIPRMSQAGQEIKSVQGVLDLPWDQDSQGSFL